MTSKQRWYWFWLKVAFWLRLRWPVIKLQRWIKGEHKAPRREVMTFETPSKLVGYATARFKYRKDQGRIGGWVFPLDWVTDPEVFQARLEGEGEPRHGDCDDYHFWAATALAKIRGVSDIYLVSTGYKGGGHATVVYRYFGAWYHLDYRIYSISDPHRAPQQVADRYGDGSIMFWVFESFDRPWRAAAIYPERLKV